MKTLYAMIGLALLLAGAPAGAVTMAELISGNTVPLKLRLGDMKTGWIQFNADESQADPMAAFARMIGEGEAIVTKPVYYSQGQIVTVEQQAFLIAYRQPKPSIDFEAMMRGRNDGDEEAEPEPLTPQTETTLTLLNINLCGHLLDIQPFSPEALKEAEKPGPNGQPGPAEIKRLQSRAFANIRQILIGIQMQAQDNDEMLPKMDDVGTLKRALHLPEKVWLNPLTKKPYGVNKQMSEKALGEIENPTETALVFDTEPWPDGKRCIGYLDGHVSMVTEAQWQEIQRAMHAALDPAVAKRREMERQLTQSLGQLRNAIMHYHADAGVYPEKLDDLLLPQNNGPKRGLTDNGKIVLLTEGYAGPYLKEMPVNPLIAADAPNYKDPATHWSYGKEEPGAVRAVNPANGTTLRGQPYHEL